MKLRAAVTVGATLGALSLLSAATATGGETGRFTLFGTVTHVVDGDTLDVRLRSGKRERVRLIGIDTPELRPAECFGSQAKTRARQLANGKRVRLIGDPTQDTRDRYRRLLAYVVLPDRRDVGRQLITEGFGTVYVYRIPFQRLSGYVAAERSANGNRRGLWSGCASGTQPPPPGLPPPLPPPRPPSGNCHASYSNVCIPPPPPDLDCGQIQHRRFTVRHDVPDPDPHRFDGDKDGIGCET